MLNRSMTLSYCMFVNINVVVQNFLGAAFVHGREGVTI